MTTTQRPWAHLVAVAAPGGRVGYVLTDQIHTIAGTRLLGRQPAWTLSDDEVDAIRAVLARMTDLAS
jgi:mRNA-degrading endonuclease toxin of MazEF toxin-antitoxin module